MKQLLVIALILGIHIITPGFTCGSRPPEPCLQGVRYDSISLDARVLNQAADFHVNDTIRFASVVSDTMLSNNGAVFIQALQSLHANINLYRVFSSGGASRLEYANNEFNLQVQNGTLQNLGAPGYHILYNRSGASNAVQTSIVPGATGLYLVTININRYSPGYDLELFTGSDLCVIYRGIADVPDAQQQLMYWNMLGTTSLPLTNSSLTVTKDQTNYFFVNVIP